MNYLDEFEADEELHKATKTARRQFVKDKVNKVYPYLLDLESIVEVDKCQAIDIGEIDIPAFLIVGTVNKLRAKSFNRDFLPLVKEDSEFGYKWKNVVKYHLSDTGISEAPIVYEYLGKFYVLEGNKRVSVLKYYGSVLITCSVKRLMPYDLKSKEVMIYEEFLEYYKYSKLYSLQFKKSGYYKKLQRLVGFEEDYVWEKQDRYQLIGIYERVSDILKKKKINVYYPDALMVLMEIVGYAHLKELSNKEISSIIDQEKNRIIFNKAHINILVVADKENETIWAGSKRDLEDIDLILSCGDLKSSYLEFLTTSFNRDVLYVHGNHDTSYDDFPPEGCICIDDDLYIHEGIRILGLGGSYDYNGGKYMYTEKEMIKRINKLKRKIDKAGGVDIIVTHAPVKGYGDMDDLAHKGFECFEKLIKKYHPEYLFYGHVHKTYNALDKGVYELEGTQIINAYDKVKIIF